jgi:hypothetical protein
MRRLFGAAVVGLLAALVCASPASAHGQDAPVATNVRVVVNGVEPAVPGVEVRAVEAGARLELTNRSAGAVEILGRRGEPFLRIRPDGVDENRNSPTLYASRSRKGEAAPVGLGRQPDWRPASNRPVVRWHEERVHGSSWTVPLLVDGAEPGVIRGAIELAEAPPAARWWIATLVLALLAAVGAGVRTAGAIVVGVVAIAVTVAFALAATTPGAAGEFAGQLVARGLSLLTGAAALAAGLAGWRRRADLALAAAGVCVTVAAGLAHSGVFANAVVAGPSWVRPAVTVVIGLGLGLTVAAARSWYLTRPAAPTLSGTGAATTTGPS